MAASTLTYTENMSGPIQAVHSGLNVLRFDVNSGASKFATLSDVYLLGKVPSGATIVGGEVNFGVNANAAATFTLLLLSDEGAGTFSTLATLRAQDAAGTSMTSNASTAQSYTIYGGGTKVSYSDDRAVRYATLALNCSVGPSATVSFSFQGNLLYTTDGR